MKSKQHKRILNVTLHTTAITLLAVALSKTLLYSFTSMLALKSSIEVKDYKLSDLYYAVADSSLPRIISENVVLVDVEGLSREEITALLHDIKAAEPKAIGVDVVFEYQYDGDSSLIDATSDPNIVMAESFAPQDNNAIHKSYFCDSNHLSHGGMVNLENGVIRNYCMQFEVGDSVYHSFAAEVAKLAGYDIDKRELDEASIYYPTLDFWALKPELFIDQYESCAERIKDKIVLVGDTANILDMHQTPIGTMGGLKIQAVILETIIGEHDIQNAPNWLNWFIAIISCAVFVGLNIILTGKKLATGKLLFRLAQILALYLFFWIGCVLFAKHNLCIDFAPSLSMIAIGLLAYDIYFGFVALYKKITVKLQNRNK
jgi:CHASE2 domain-containing sensor protein